MAYLVFVLVPAISLGALILNYTDRRAQINKQAKELKELNQVLEDTIKLDESLEKHVEDLLKAYPASLRSDSPARH